MSLLLLGIVSLDSCCGIIMGRCLVEQETEWVLTQESRDGNAEAYLGRHVVVC